MEHRFGEAVPGGLAAGGVVEGAAHRRAGQARRQDGGDRGGDVAGRGRGAALVGDDAQLVAVNFSAGRPHSLGSRFQPWVIACSLK